MSKKQKTEPKALKDEELKNASGGVWNSRSKIETQNLVVDPNNLEKQRTHSNVKYVKQP